MRLDLIFSFITFTIGMINMFFVIPFNVELGFLLGIVTFIFAMITLYLSCKITDNEIKNIERKRKND